MNERSEQQLMNVEVAMHVVEAMVASFLADTSALNRQSSPTLGAQSNLNWRLIDEKFTVKK